MLFLRCLLLVGLYFCTLGAANATDWVAEKVRQPAHYSYKGKSWVEIEVGKTMPSGSWIRTGSRGRLKLKRGEEFIQFKPKTMASIGKTDRTGKKTLVMQKYGSLLLDVETRKRKHLTVETPFLAAVVKGTRFSVDVGKRSAKLSVERGVVEVTDERRGLQSDVRSNQSVRVLQNARTTTMRVLGPGKKTGIKIVKRSAPKVQPEPARRSLLEVALGFTKDRTSVGSTNSKTVSKSSKNSKSNGNSANGNSANSNAGGNSNSGNSNGNSSNSNSGGNGNSSSNGGGNSNSGGGGNSNSGGGNGNGNNGNGNGNGGSNGGGNGNGNNGNGNGNGGSNGGGNGNGNNGNGNGNN